MGGIRVGMRGIGVEMREIGVGMRGTEWNRNRKKSEKKVYKIQFSFFPEIEKKKKKQQNLNCHKMLTFVLSNEKQKASLPGSHVRFSHNDLNQRYCLNEMWTCGPPVTIVNFLFSNEKVALYTRLLTTKGLKLNINSNRFKL